MTEETDDRALVVRYLEAYAANIRTALAKVDRDGDGRASLFTLVGQAERQGINLEFAAMEIEAAARGVANGVHLGYRRRRNEVEVDLIVRYMRDRGRFAAKEVAKMLEEGAHRTDHASRSVAAGQAPRRVNRRAARG